VRVGTTLFDAVIASAGVVPRRMRGGPPALEPTGVATAAPVQAVRSNQKSDDLSYAGRRAALQLLMPQVVTGSGNAPASH
jgi:hypothetical protein